MFALACTPARAAVRNASIHHPPGRHTSTGLSCSSRKGAASRTLQQDRGAALRARASPGSAATKEVRASVSGAVSTVSAADLSAQLADVTLVIDVRSQEQWVCSGHIACTRSLNTPLSDLPAYISAQKLDGTPRDDLVALVADDTAQALAAAEVLAAQAGFSRVLALEGGFSVWAAADLPIEYGTDCDTIQMHCPWLEGSDQGCAIDGGSAMEELVF